MGKNRNQTRRRNKQKKNANSLLRKPLTPFQLQLVNDSREHVHPMHGWPTAIIVLVCEWRQECHRFEVQFNLRLQKLHDCYFAHKALMNITIMCKSELLGGGLQEDMLDTMLEMMGNDKVLAKALFDHHIESFVHDDIAVIDSFFTKMRTHIDNVVGTGFPKFKQAVKDARNRHRYIDYETTNVLEEPRDTTKCVKCDVVFCRCDNNHRCKKAPANLPCGCEGWCQECMIDHSRNTAEMHCVDPSCTLRTFRCLRCYDTLYFDKQSNRDCSRAFWGPLLHREDGSVSVDDTPYESESDDDSVVPAEEYENVE